MNIFDIIIFSLTQALTEFLPISSSGHLILLAYFKDIPSNLAFDVALHLGTVLAILIYFYKDIWQIIIGFFINLKTPSNLKTSLVPQIIIATIPAVVVGGLIAYFKIADFLRILPIIGINLIVFGILLYFIDKKSNQKIVLFNINYKQSILVGLAQALALVPGVSRSGICFTMGRFLGIEKSSAIRFSFFISIPAILGAAFLELVKESTVSSFDIMPFLIGAVLSFFFGLLVIKFLMIFIQKFSFKVFAIYRVLLGLFVLYYYYFGL
jgi:undecaprenyl-diphosphatase